MNAGPKVVAIGFDAVEHRLIEQWTRAGELPNLCALRVRGAYGRLRGPTGMGDDAAWATFYTALSPARHGRYKYRAIQPGSYRTPFWNDRYLCAEPFWDTLSRRGKRIALIDVPKSPLSSSINGLQLADWRVHGRDHRTCSNPPAMAQQVLDRFGDDPLDRLDAGPRLCEFGYLPGFDYADFVARLVRSVEDKTVLSTELLAREPWDLFMVVFKEGHCAGHKLWHLQDPLHYAHPAGAGEADTVALKRVYQALDRALGTLLERVGPETAVIVFSDLGMAGNFTANHLFDRILLRLEFAELSWGGRAELAWNLLKLQAGRRWLRKDGENFSRGIRLYYTVPHGEQAAAIRLNVVGREPSGRIHRGVEFEAHLDRLESALGELVDPESGRRLVKEFVRVGRTFEGENRDRLPDLLVVWDRTQPIFAVRSPRIGTIRAPDPQLRTGNHIDDGWFVAAGPGITRGEVEPASLMDIAPSIATLLGETLPGVDGRPIPALAIGGGAASGASVVGSEPPESAQYLTP